MHSLQIADDIDNPRYLEGSLFLPLFFHSVVILEIPQSAGSRRFVQISAITT